MKVPYFKKKKMYEIVSEFLPDVKMPKLISCTYRFYRGSEWLSFAYDDDSRADACVCVSLYHCGYYVTLDLEYRHYAMDEDLKKFKVVKRSFWLQSDGSLRPDYESEYYV